MTNQPVFFSSLSVCLFFFIKCVGSKWLLPLFVLLQLMLCERCGLCELCRFLCCRVQPIDQPLPSLPSKFSPSPPPPVSWFAPPHLQLPIDLGISMASLRCPGGIVTFSERTKWTKGRRVIERKRQRKPPKPGIRHSSQHRDQCNWSGSLSLGFSHLCWHYTIMAQ